MAIKKVGRNNLLPTDLQHTTKALRILIRKSRIWVRFDPVKISTPPRPQTEPCWCRWTRSPGATASCSDIGALNYDSTPKLITIGFRHLNKRRWIVYV